MNIEIITNVIIPIFGAILLYIVVPYIREKTTKEQREDVYFWVQLAVQSAEQIFTYRNAGQDKKEYVLEFMDNQGFDVTEDELDVMIEAAVLELNKVKGELQ